jgi:hypothetical protein
VFGIPLLAFSVALAALAPSPWVLFASVAIYGATFAVTNLAMNVEVDRVEARIGSRLLNRCHGAASIGLLAASLAGAAARGAEVHHSWHLVGLLPLVVVATLALAFRLQSAPARPHTGKRHIVPRPTAATVLLVGVVLSGVVIEGAARTWSIIYMRESFSLPAWLEALALTTFLVAMVLGRLAGDGLASRFGPVAVGRAALLVGIAGLAVLVLAPDFLFALIGFGLLGLGASVIYPLVLSSAARLGDRPASENVAAMTMVSAPVVLGVPALLGSIAEAWGVRAIFTAIVPVALLSLAVSRILARRGDRP